MRLYKIICENDGTGIGWTSMNTITETEVDAVMKSLSEMECSASHKAVEVEMLEENNGMG